MAKFTTTDFVNFKTDFAALTLLSDKSNYHNFTTSGFEADLGVAFSPTLTATGNLDVVSESGPLHSLALTQFLAGTNTITGLSLNLDTLTAAVNKGVPNALALIFAHADNITGSSGDDFIKGYAGKDTIHGGGGDDRLYGGGGNDTIFGNGSDDHIYGDSGADILNGGAGKAGATARRFIFRRDPTITERFRKETIRCTRSRRIDIGSPRPDASSVGIAKL